MVEELIKKIAKELYLQNIPYMIIGGQAALLYREPRFTNDIDLSLGVDIDKLDAILNMCEKLKLNVLIAEPADFVSKTMVLPVADNVSGVRADFIFSFTDYEHEAIKRANVVNVDGVDVNYCSLEDLIILKIFAGRERDIEDVRNILIKNPSFNMELVMQNLNELAGIMGIDYSERFQKIFDSIKK